MMLTLRAEMAELGRLNDWVDGRVATLALEGRLAYGLRLCVEELVSNVLLHSDARTLWLQIEGPPPRLMVEDDGAAFDPTGVEAPAVPGAIAEASIGGRGLMLARAYAQRLDWQRVEDRNRVTVDF